jgi:hypothetical protein
MAASVPSQPPTPERFFHAVNAHHETEAIKSAIELDVFTAIAEGNATAQAIAKRCQAAERGVRILCDFLTINGFLLKDADGYTLAPDSALFLARNSSSCSPRICVRQAKTSPRQCGAVARRWAMELSFRKIRIG